MLAVRLEDAFVAERSGNELGLRSVYVDAH